MNKIILDTSVNAAATGIFLMMNGLPKSEGSLLIARDVLLHPDNPWKINDMGVLLRDNEMYKDAIICFKYADKILVNSLTVKSNIGWTAFYFGDFAGAKKYFDDALTLNEYYKSALEGRALIAFREGDLQALFRCLIKEVTSLGGGTAAPSEPFSTVCDPFLSQQDNINLDTQPDPTAINIYDNLADNEKVSTSAASGSQTIDLPQFDEMFDEQPCNWINPDLKAKEYMVFDLNNAGKYLNEINALKNTLSPISKPPYIDANGDEIVPKNYEKSLAMYNHIEALYLRRVSWHLDHFTKELKELMNRITNDVIDRRNAYTNQCHACPAEPEDANQRCRNEAACQWFPIMRASDNNNLNNKRILYNKYFTKMIDESEWYNKLSSVYIKRITDKRWNNYLNKKREYNVRNSVMGYYGKWATNMGGADVLYCDGKLVCSTPVREMSGDNAPPNGKPKKIATFPEPCYSSPMSASIPGMISVESSCEQDKISLGPDALKLGVAKIHKHSADQDDYFRTSITTGISAKENVGNYKLDKSSVSADLILEATATVYFDMDQQFNTIRRGAKLDLSPSAEAQVSTGVSAIDNSLGLKTGHGISASVEIIAQAGQNATPGYKVIVSGNKN